MEFEGENSSFRRFDIKRASDFFTGGSGDVCLWIFTGAGDPFVAVSSGDNGTPSGMSSDMRDLREQKRPSWQRARKRRRRGPQKKKEKKGKCSDGSNSDPKRCFDYSMRGAAEKRGVAMRSLRRGHGGVLFLNLYT